jgi:hypothetical protein
MWRQSSTQALARQSCAAIPRCRLKLPAGQAGVPKVGPFEVRAPQRRLAQISMPQTRTAEIGVIELRALKICLAQIGVVQVGAPEGRAREVGPSKVGTAQLGMVHIRPPQVGPAQICLAEVGAPEQLPIQAGIGESGPRSFDARSVHPQTVAVQDELQQVRRHRSRLRQPLFPRSPDNVARSLPHRATSAPFRRKHTATCCPDELDHFARPRLLRLHRGHPPG